MARDPDINEPTREFPGYPTAESLHARSDAKPDAPTPANGQARSLLWVLGAAALAVVVLLGVQATGILPDFRNPFAKEQTDRSQPPLLKSIRDLSRYVAAEGNFQVVVDLQNDRNNVPEFLLNQRTLFVGAGSVEAYVDFAKISDGAVVVSPDGKSVEIKLPAPQLGETNLDLEKSYVFAEQRGLLNRLNDLVAGDPNRQQQVYQLADERITAAARDSGLTARAEENTRKMLEGLLRSLGYEKVTVTYTAS
ncbi:DUF4230 domain-containing protein [Micromonospora globispora]|uniref:DUF4230 domain-containing protein n=1 Tax=Micromonospora globispora TaxID=1450148 RepID=A0A317K2T8_9ACTN|nr:DUF4230 domain-containing protein [Micromonospora globispora]PWU47246.1 DUF4230 domain-containing protein [Micromonospora globispora]PWU59110.1 DUF4230 domain-containing protein [Micromonospora globispora]RQX07500.1 DUF4230 domain-containing protein [Micromonospora globispora]